MGWRVHHVPKPPYCDKIRSRATWELRSFKDKSLVAKGDLAFVTKRMLEIEGGIYGSTHFMIPADGYMGFAKKS